MGYETFAKLCEERNVKAADVSRATGIDTSTFSSWKKGDYSPKLDKLKRIADYFGVSLEYLDTGNESLRNMEREVQVADEDLKELYLLAKKATPEQKEIAIKFFHALK